MPETILIIDNDTDILESLRDVLVLEGYQVVTASDGKKAFSELLNGTDSVDLIIADIMMPYMNGTEFRRRQLEIDHLASIPILFTSASLRRTSESESCKVFSKPFQLEELLEAVKAAFCLRGKVLDHPTPLADIA